MTGEIETFLTTGFRLPCGPALGTRLLFATGLLAIGFVVLSGFGSVPMAAAVAEGLCMLFGFLRGLAIGASWGIRSGRSAGTAGPMDLAGTWHAGVGPGSPDQRLA